MMATRKKLPDILTDQEAKRLIEIPNKRYYTGLRNKAMVTLMLNTGLRVSEIANLKTNSIDLKTRALCFLQVKIPHPPPLQLSYSILQ